MFFFVDISSKVQFMVYRWGKKYCQWNGFKNIYLDPTYQTVLEIKICLTFESKLELSRSLESKGTFMMLYF